MPDEAINHSSRRHLSGVTASSTPPTIGRRRSVCPVSVVWSASESPLAR